GEVQPTAPPSDTANTMLATATVISAAPPTSSRRRVLCSRPRPSSRGVSSTAATPTGTLTRKTVRQLVDSTRPPPSTWPATKPTDAVAPYRPSARVRGGPSGNPVVISDSAAGAT